MRCRLATAAAFSALAALVVAAAPALAQVEVSPDNAETAAPAKTSDNTFRFLIESMSLQPHTYSLSCTVTGSVVGCAAPSSVDLPALGSMSVQVSYETGGPGQGSLTLLVASKDDGADQGSLSVRVGSPLPGTPMLVRNSSTDNGFNVDRSRCISTGVGGPAAFQCGDLVLVHAFPAYKSLNEMRALSLVYNSRTVDPRPALLVDLTIPASDKVPPSRIIASLDLERDGSVDVGPVYYQGPPAPLESTEVYRVSLPVEAATRPTGLVRYAAKITYEYEDGSRKELEFEDHFLIVNRRNSPYGAGWAVASVPRVFALSADTVTIVDGDGSIQLFTNPDPDGVFTSPPGEYSKLTRRPGGGFELASRGELIRAIFDPAGLLTRVEDRVGNTARYFWSTQSGQPALDSIVDAAGQVVRLGYAAGRLVRVDIPGYGPFQVMTGGVTLDSIVDPDGLKTRFAYADLRLNRWTSRGLGPWSFQYDSLGSLAHVDPPASGDLALRSHLAEGRALPGTGTAANPAPLGLADSAYLGHTDGRGFTTRFWVDRFGAPTRIHQPEHSVPILIERDSLLSFPKRLTFPNGRVIVEEWNPLDGTLTKWIEVKRNNATTTYEYDAALKLPTRITPPDPDLAVAMAYDPVTGLRTWIANTAGDTTRFSYNSFGLVDTIWQPLDTIPVAFEYTALGNLRRIIEAGGDARRAITTLNYDSATGTRLVSVTDAEGKTTSILHDRMGRDSIITETGGGLTARIRFERDDLNRTVRRFDPEGRRTRWVMDAEGRVVQRCSGSLDEKCASYTYDGSGNLRTETTRQGEFLTYEYDGLNRLRVRTVPGGIPDAGAVPATGVDRQEFVYDDRGRLLSAKNFYAEVTYEYNPDGTVTHERLRITPWDPADPNAVPHVRDVYYRYAPDGFRRALSFASTFPDSIYWQRGARGITLIGNSYHEPDGTTPLEFQVVYDRNGRRTSVSVPELAWYREKLTYDDADRLRGHRFGSGLIDSLTYDLAGRVKQVYGTVTYLYDGLGRLDESSGLGDNQEDFSYDLAGNRTHWFWQAANAKDVSYEYWPDNGRLRRSTDQVSGCVITFTYDEEGRRIREDGDHESCQGKPIDIYTYGADGKLRQHKKSYETPSGQRLTETRIYWYDALGRRILMHSPDTLANGARPRDYGTWRYYYAGDQLITVSQSNPLDPDVELGPWTRFTPGLGPNELLAGIIDRPSPSPDIQKFYVRDRLGSVRVVRDETGTTVATAGYSAFGEEKAGTPPIESGFAGGLGAGDLVQFRHRYYDPETGQFLTEDPIGFAGGGNLYAYAANNPVSYTDPFGLCPPELTGRPCTALHALGIAVGSAVGGALGGAGGAAAGTVVLPVAGTLGGGAAGVAAGAAQGAVVGLAVANIADVASDLGADAVERLRVNWRKFIGQLGLALGLEVLREVKPPDPEPPRQENVGPPPPDPKLPEWLKLNQ